MIRIGTPAESTEVTTVRNGFVRFSPVTGPSPECPVVHGEEPSIDEELLLGESD